MLDNSFNEKIILNIQPNPSFIQLEAVSSCPTTCCLEETDMLAQTSPVPPFLHTKSVKTDLVGFDFHPYIVFIENILCLTVTLSSGQSGK